MVYSIGAIFKLNKAYHCILILYGMKKNNSLIFMILDNLPTIILSILFGGLVTFFMSKIFDKMIVGKLSFSVVSSFNIIFVLLVSLITICLNLIIIVLYYAFLFFDKKKSYIGL